MWEPAANDQDKDVHGDQVDEEHVAAPGGNHVEVGYGAQGGPVDSSGLYGLDPEVVGEQHAENGDAFIIVWASNGPKNNQIIK